MNGDDVLLTVNVPYGDTPVYSGDTPAKASAVEYTYKFAGWSPEIVPVTGPATYTAVFNTILNKYTVTWKNYDGTVLGTSLVNYGTIPEFDGIPYRESDGEYSYVFTGWDPAIVPVTENTEYIAQYHDVTALKYVADGHTAEFIIGDIEDIVTEVLIYTDEWDISIPISLLNEFRKSSTLKVSVNVSDPVEIPVNMLPFIGDRTIISLQMFVDDEIISDFDTNEVTVSLHYVPDDGHDMSDVSVWYVNYDTLELEEAEVHYDEHVHMVRFTTNHFSYWVIGEKSPVSEPTHDTSMIVWLSVILIMVLSVVLLRMKR
jgi:hypothetical protein